MTCENFRKLISAQLDGEVSAQETQPLETHLHDCVECRQWQDQSLDLNRLLRVGPANAASDFTHLADAVAVPPRRRWLVAGVLVACLTVLRRDWARIELAFVAIAQTVLGIEQMVSSRTGSSAMQTDNPAVGGVTSHLFGESAAWNIAIGAALLWLAYRPRLASGMLPFMSIFVAVLSVILVHDLTTGAATLGHVLPHMFLLPGLALLFVLHRQGERWGMPPTPTRVGTDSESHRSGTADYPVASPGSTQPARHLRPAGKAA